MDGFNWGHSISHSLHLLHQQVQVCWETHTAKSHEQVCSSETMRSNSQGKPPHPSFHLIMAKGTSLPRPFRAPTPPLAPSCASCGGGHQEPAAADPGPGAPLGGLAPGGALPAGDGEAPPEEGALRDGSDRSRATEPTNLREVRTGWLPAIAFCWLCFLFCFFSSAF